MLNQHMKIGSYDNKIIIKHNQLLWGKNLLVLLLCPSLYHSLISKIVFDMKYFHFITTDSDHQLYLLYA